MATHRYWRAVGLEAYGAGDLELSCFHLLDVAGARVDAPATLTASTAPATGAVASLQDTDLTTSARWAASSLAALTLNWDFGGSPVDVAVPQLAGSVTARFLMCCGVQYSDDGVTWVEAFTLAGVTWPEGGLTSTLSIYGAWSPTEHGTACSVGVYGDVLQIPGTTQAGKGVTPHSAGIYQFEVLIVQWPAATISVGVMTAAVSPQTYVGSVAGGFGYSSNSFKYLAGTQTAYGASYTTGDVIGVVVNFSTGALTFYKNGVSQGVASAAGMLGLTLYPAASYVSAGSNTAIFQLAEANLTYPVAGATAWGLVSKSVLKNKFSRTASSDPITVGTGPTIIYGIPQVVEPVNLTVQSGAIKDYVTGVLGTGRGRVSGVVREKATPNAPVYRKVRLIREKDGLVVRGDVWSDPVTGAYNFDYIDELQSWAVYAHDHTFAFRDQIASNLTLANGGVELIP